MINKVILVGRLGADVELKYTKAGTAVGDIRLATDRKWKDNSGATKNETEWHRVVVWGKTAEACKEYIGKGSQVYVEGRIQTQQWEDRDGHKRYTTQVVAEQVKFLGSKGGGSSKGGGTSNAPSGEGEAPSDDSPPAFGDDDLPF